MFHPVPLLLLLSLTAPCLCYKGQGWWLQQPYDDDDKFNIRQEYGATFEVRENASMSTVEYWVLPDMSIIDKNNLYEEYTSIDGVSRTTWIDNGHALNVSLLLEDQFGFYFCHGAKANGDRVVIKLAVNYGGSFFGSMWEMYRMNTIIGCGAAGAFLVLAVISYVVLEWWCGGDDTSEDDTDKQDHTTSYRNAAYSNGATELDDKPYYHDNSAANGEDYSVNSDATAL